MPQTIDRLRSDHQRLRAVLESISKVCGELENDDFDVHSDYLFCLVDYLVGYPDRVHHPTEDLVFDKLLEMPLAKEELEKISRNRSQHSDLKAATLELMDLVETPAGSIDAKLFARNLEKYVLLQQKHMRFEEQEIFPLALEHIPASGWEELDARFGESKDPLFDEADARYATLFRFLVPTEHDKASFAEPLLRYLSATGR